MLLNKMKLSIRVSGLKYVILLFKVQKIIGNINPKVSKTNNGKTMILSICAICGSKKSRFIKK